VTDPVYLDYAATTPVDPQVIEAMSACLGMAGDFGNSSSLHAYGVRPAARIERAREQVAALIGAEPDEIVFTSGATESINLAILGAARANAARGRHIVTSRIEHKAGLDACKWLERQGFPVSYLTPDRSGRIDPALLRSTMRPDTVLVSVMHANNEIGVLQDVAALTAVCREREVLFHTDAAQSVGKVPLDVQALGADFMSFTAHKIYGPKGVGGLYVRRAKRAYLQPSSFGGGQERGLRPGTLPTHQLVGFGLACELARARLPEDQRLIAALRDQLWAGLASLGGVHLNAEGAPRVPGILNVSFEGVEGESLVTSLPQLALSTGSACNSATGEPSYVLRALGRDTQLAQSSLRFSLGRLTTSADIELAVDAVRHALRRLRAVSPGWPASDVSPPAHAGPASSPQLSGLSPVVREHFLGTPRALVRPAAAREGGVALLGGEAGGRGQEVWVRFHLTVERDIVKDARFEAYGCPHTVAVASWLAGQLPGRGRDNLIPGEPSGWAEALGVPVEKLGRLLTVEDALRACLRHWP
jgi:cysteine desulfurase